MIPVKATIAPAFPMTTPTLSRSDALANRRRVVEAARQLFAGRGAAVEMKEIAEAAGVGVGTIYRNFATKEELLAAIVEAAEGEALEVLNGVRAVSDPRRRIAVLIETALGEAERNRGLFSMIDHQDTPPPAAIMALLEGILQDALDAGVIPGDADAAFLAAYLAAQFRLYVELRDRFSAEACHARLTALLGRALLAPEAGISGRSESPVRQ